MNRNLPWKIPYCALLTEIVSRWGGKRSDGDGTICGENSGESVLVVYPVYSGEIRDFPLMLQISGFPIYRPERFELSGQNEYLRIHIARSLACNLEIHNRQLLHRRMLVGRTDGEFISGKVDSTESYYLEVRSTADRGLVEDTVVRNTIGRLEPFAVLALTPTGIYWAQNLETPDQLGFPTIEKYIQGLVDLAEIFIARL